MYNLSGLAMILLTVQEHLNKKSDDFGKIQNCFLYPCTLFGRRGRTGGVI